MCIRIMLESQSPTHREYEVTFFDNVIQTTVTHMPWVVDAWISITESIHGQRLTVGLDIEWPPNLGSHLNNPVAILQLCVGRRCLIFKLLYADYMPCSLMNFLGNQNHAFVGVGIANDVQKLVSDYNLTVRNAIDLRDLALNQWGVDVRSWGLKHLAGEVLYVEFDKPSNVTLSRWDNYYLTDAQVQYACVDAFVSFEIGRILRSEYY